MPRLAFLLPNLRGGGAERVALDLILDFVERGYAIDLLLLVRGGELLPLVPASVRIIDLNAARMRDAFGPLVRYFRESEAVAIQVSMWPVTVIAIAAHRLARSKARIVVSDHSTLSRQYAPFGKRTLRLLKASIRLLYPLAHARIAVSAAVADDLARLSGIDRGSIAVVYNPVGKPSATHVSDARGAELWGTGGSRILTVGSFIAAKNHALLIAAFARLSARRPARLAIVGDGALRPELEALVARAGLTDSVSMPGFVLDPWPYYASADLFVLSSDYEGLPVVLIEAMRSGLAIVSTDCQSGPRELLEDGAYGRLVPCNDPDALAEAMNAALDAVPDPRRLQTRAREIVDGVPERYLELMVPPGSRETA